MWTYESATGWVYDPTGGMAGQGYSGFQEAKNQPDLDFLKARGPIPRGRWTIGPPHESLTTGDYTLSLTPVEGTETHGRKAFAIHGDSRKAPGTASKGCIILARGLRERIWMSGDRELLVVPIREERSVNGLAV